MDDSIRAMTWNVWWRFGGNWREREPGLIAVLRDVDPDLLGIQECWGSEERTQADMVAEALGERYAAFVEQDMPPVPDPPEDDTQRGVVMGIGLVSRWPIASVERVDVPSEGRRNAALVATISRPNGELRVVVGATSWEPERVQEAAVQFAELQRLTRDGHSLRPNPSILLADLNYDPGQPALAGMHLIDAWNAAEPGADPRTLSSDESLRAAGGGGSVRPSHRSRAVPAGFRGRGGHGRPRSARRARRDAAVRPLPGGGRYRRRGGTRGRSRGTGERVLDAVNPGSGSDRSGQSLSVSAVEREMQPPSAGARHLHSVMA